MSYIRFDWDERKNRTNIHDHGVSFEEAKTTFYDPQARIIHDPDHSEEQEDRFILLGFSQKLRILVVSHCYREPNEIVRIISARKAEKHEQAQYEAMRGE